MTDPKTIMAREDDPEPALHSEHVLTITQLDYMRLRSWLIKEQSIREARLKNIEQMLPEESDTKKLQYLQAFQQLERTEVCALQRIIDGLHSRWKPGRAPGDVARDKKRERAMIDARSK